MSGHDPADRRDVDRRGTLPGRRVADLARITPPLPSWAGPALSAAAALTAGARAFDFLTEPPRTAQLQYVELIGLAAWGSAFLAVAALLVVGVVVRFFAGYRQLLLFGHGLAIPVYGGFIIALVQSLVVNGGAVRGVATATAGLILHIVMTSALVERRVLPSRGVLWNR